MLSMSTVDLVALQSNSPKPMSSSEALDSSFFSSFLASAGAAASAGPAAAGAAEPADEPTLVISSFTFVPSRALAKSPGQYGSTETPAAFEMVVSFSPVMATWSSAKMRAAYTQASSSFPAISLKLGVLETDVVKYKCTSPDWP